MADNLIQVGAQFEGAQLTAGVRQATEQVKSNLDEMSAGFEKHSARSKVAMQSIALAAEEMGIAVSAQTSQILAELPLVGAAFELAFPVVAAIAAFGVLKQLGEKLSEIISDTFIYTKAQKEQDAALKTANQSLLQQSLRVNQLGRENQIAAEKTAAGQERLKLQFKLEDLGGDPAALKAKKETAINDLKKAQDELAKMKAMGAPVASSGDEATDISNYAEFSRAVTEAEAKVAGLENTINAYAQTIKVAEGETKKTSIALNNLAGEQPRKNVEQATKNYDLLKAKAEESLKVRISDLKATEAAVVASFTAQGATMEEAKAKADAIYGPQVLQARLDFYSRMGAAATTQAEKNRLASEAHIATNQAAQHSNEALAQSQARFHTIQDQQHKEDMKRESEAGKQAVALAAERNKELLKQFELMESLGNKRIETIDKELAALKKLIDSGKLNANTTAAAYGRIHQLELQRQKDLAADMIASGKLGKVFHGTLLQMITDGQNWQTKVGNTFKQTIDKMNNELAQFVTTGKANWAQLAASAIESILQILLQQAEAWAAGEILDALGLGKKKVKNVSQAESSAHTAAANTLAEVPFPENIAASVGIDSLGQGYAIAAASSAGGDWRVDRDRLNFVHKDETILPPGISGKLRDMVEGAGSGGSGDVHVHMSVNAIDSQSFEGAIKKHGHMIGQQVMRVMKRRGGK